MSKTTETNGKAEQGQAEPEPQALRRLTVHTDDAGRAVIRRAITLRLAMLGEVGSDDPELHGAALAGIVSQWLQTMSELLREAR